MPSDEQLIHGLRDGLSPLRPAPGLLEQLRDRAAVPDHPPGRRLRRPDTRPGRGFRQPAVALMSIAAVVISVGVLVGAVFLVRHRGPGAVTQAQPASDGVILAGDGLGGVRFGASPEHLRSLIDPVLGTPQSSFQSTPRGQCGVDGTLLWPILSNPNTGRVDRSEELVLTFLNRRFIGYQYGAAVATQGYLAPFRLRAATARGLRLGDSLAFGRQLYGTAFQISSAQGGSWSVRTPQGELRGYTDVTAQHSVTSPLNRIELISAGTVGCPAASP